jgi:hypothetical protein
MTGVPCDCGSSLPVIQLQGRRDDILHLRSHTGKTLKVLPLALETVLEEGAGIHWFQVIQTGPSSLQIRLQDQQAWPACERALSLYLQRQGLSNIQLKHDHRLPRLDPCSGKLRRILHQPAKARPPTIQSSPEF